jgi:hypothetical protein
VTDRHSRSTVPGLRLFQLEGMTQSIVRGMRLLSSTGLSFRRGYPLRLHPEVDGHDFVVNNAVRLDMLEQWLGAKLRERGPSPGLIMKARLPRWRKAGKGQAGSAEGPRRNPRPGEARGPVPLTPSPRRGEGRGQGVLSLRVVAGGRTPSPYPLPQGRGKMEGSTLRPAPPASPRAAAGARPPRTFPS